MLSEKERAMLGEQEAQEAFTARGELLPCPCCGKQPRHFGGASIAYVHCDGCGLEICRMDADGDDVISRICSVSPKHEAVLAWNTRPQLLTQTQMALLERLEEEK